MDSETPTPTTINIDYSNEESALAARFVRRSSRIGLAPA